MDWKPIETAPKTDDPILVAYDNGDVEIVTDSDETDWEPVLSVEATRAMLKQLADAECPDCLTADCQVNH